MSASTEEATKQIERIVHASTASLRALLVLLHPFMSVLIVDSSHLSVGEDVVGFGYFDEFLVRSVIVGIFVGVVLLRKGTVRLFDLTIVGIFVEAKELNCSWLV